MDDNDIASRFEQFDREIAIANQRIEIAKFIEPQVCAGCDESPHGKACSEYARCLSDYDKRAAAVRNGGDR